MELALRRKEESERGEYFIGKGLSGIRRFVLKELKHWQLMPVAVAITVITGETSISFGFSVGATGQVFSSLTPRDHPLALTLAACFLLTAVPIALLPALPSVKKTKLKVFPFFDKLKAAVLESFAVLVLI